MSNRTFEKRISKIESIPGNSAKEKARLADLLACLKRHDAILAELDKLSIAEQQQITNQAISEVLEWYVNYQKGGIQSE